MRFRKRVKIGGFNINLSGSGVGFSVGVPGFRTGISSTGKKYTSYGLPGTGLYDVKYDSSNKQSKNTDTTNQDSTALQIENNALPTELTSNQGCLWSVITFVMVCTKPEVGFLSLIIQLIWYFHFYKKSDKYIASILFKDAIKALNNRDYYQVRDLCAQILLKFPKIKKVHEMVTDSYLKEDNYDDAFNNLQKYATSLEDQLKLIDIAYAGKKYQIVIEYCQKLPPEIKNDVSVITLLGSSYYLLEKLDVALEVLLQGPTRKRNMDHNIAEFRYILGLVYEGLNQHKNAIKQYNKIIAFDSSYRDVAERLENLEK